MGVGSIGGSTVFVRGVGVGVVERTRGRAYAYSGGSRAGNDASSSRPGADSDGYASPACFHIAANRHADARVADR
jgi:hypothetical protein